MFIEKSLRLRVGGKTTPREAESLMLLNWAGRNMFRRPIYLRPCLSAPDRRPVRTTATSRGHSWNQG
jgi:hypothetical protein